MAPRVGIFPLSLWQRSNVPFLLLCTYPPCSEDFATDWNECRFGKFVEVVEFAGLTEELNGDGPVTVLAPTDGAMDNMRDELAEKVMEDAETAALFVRHHVLKDMLCCAGIPRQMPFFNLSRRRTAAGDLVSVQRSHGGHIYADR